ncbi:MAG: hypothetical protein EON48_00610 [Acetobacteraceae bacterium]|nr:MAG: hypothetical protein EON48_00610 [Acetobacteraceae bacterium]
MKFLQVYAVVDTEYRLLWVGGEWDEFALQNAAQQSLANNVLSTTLMAHIAGEQTRKLTARLIDTVLDTKRPLRVEYRCDSPSMARLFLLTIQPMKDGRALMVHDLKDAWHFSPPLNMWHYDPQAKDCKCSFCGDIRFGQATEWTSCDDIGDRHPTHVSYEVCLSCQEAVADAVEKVVHEGDFDVAVQHDLPASNQRRDHRE